MLPHLGASTEEAEQNCAIIAVDQLRAFLEDGAIANAVNFPNVDMPRESPFRVAIANANVPNMLGQISTAMARGGLNIHNMVNKSRGEMAYTLVDVDSAIPDALIESIAAIEGVLSVRAIPQRVMRDPARPTAPLNAAPHVARRFDDEAQLRCLRFDRDVVPVHGAGEAALRRQA
jgi:hypothetical protein